MATKTFPDTQTCAFPGETPTLAVDVEADLQGRVVSCQDRYAEAEEMYARGLALRAATVDVAYFLHNNRGYCLNLLGRHADAEAHTRAAIALDPERHNAHKNLGLALAGQGRLGEAVRCLLEADRRCPPDTRARGHLTELLTEHPELLAGDSDLAATCRERGDPSWTGREGLTGC